MEEKSWKTLQTAVILNRQCRCCKNPLYVNNKNESYCSNFKCVLYCKVVEEEGEANG